MATVSRENLGTLHEKITVKIEKQDYLPTFEKNLKEQAKKANMPGFRKGMVPVGLVKKMYGQTIFTDEIIRGAGKQLEDYLKKEQISIFAQPMILPDQNLKFDMAHPSDYDFFFEIGIKPDFDVTPVTNKATITRYQIEITDKMLDDELDRLKKQFGTEIPQEAITDNGQIVNLVFADSTPDGTLIEGMAETKSKVVFGSLPAKLQEFLLGKKTGDTMILHPIDVCTEEELPQFLKTVLKNTGSAEKYYQLSIESINVLEPLEVGPELFDKVYKDQGVTEEADFRDRIKAELTMEYARLTGERLQNEIFELLVHNTPIELPVQFLKRYLAEGGENPKTAETVESEYPHFEHSLRWQLITDKLLNEYHIRVTRDEVLDEIMHNVLAYFGVTNIEDAPWLESYRAKVSKDEKTMEETYTKMVTTRLFSALESALTLEDKMIAEEDFFKLGDAHAAHHHH